MADNKVTTALETKTVTKAKSRKACPNCNATVFQGPFQRGPIEDGTFITREVWYQCVNCHTAHLESELVDQPTVNW